MHMPIRTRSVLLTLTLMFCACSTQIQHGLDERDANELLSVLTAHGFEARKVAEKGKKPTWAIEVTDDRATDAMRLLAELKLPRAPKLTTAKIAGETALIETPAAEKLRQLEGLEGDLEQALETIDGVTSAAVELAVPPTPRPGTAVTPAKASVLLRVASRSLEHLQQQRAELRALVAASVDGLHSEDVVLVIDEVQGRLPETITSKSERGLRLTLMAVSAMLMILAMFLVGMALRIKKQNRVLEQKANAPPAPTPVQPAVKPVIATRVQRKVA